MAAPRQTSLEPGHGQSGGVSPNPTRVDGPIVNHSTYHRGQAASKLERFGIEQSITDFFWWVIEQISQEASGRYHPTFADFRAAIQDVLDRASTAYARSWRR
jgi:hypothetical protein